MCSPMCKTSASLWVRALVILLVLSPLCAPLGVSLRNGGLKLPISNATSSLLTVTVMNQLSFSGFKFFHTARALGHEVLPIGIGDTYKGNGDKIHKLKVALESLQITRGTSYMHETVIFFT